MVSVSSRNGLGMSEPIRIATRGSALALAQANQILAQCQAAFPAEQFELLVVKTTGDKLQTASLSGGALPKGLFTKELEVALLEQRADFAVHSLKDLPTELPAGLRLGAVTERADVRDVLIYRHIEFLAQAPGGAPVQSRRRGFKPELSIAALPARATVATSSTRRAAQLQEIRPDLQIVPIRGNVGTRLRKLAEQSELDALVLASAGLGRLQVDSLPGGQLRGLDVPPGLAMTPLSVSQMLPCVGQAAIGLETRAHDERVARLCERLNHQPTLQCVTAERSFLSAMGGGCLLAVAAFARPVVARVEGQSGGVPDEIEMDVVSYLGGRIRRASGRGAGSQASELGQALAGQLQG
jgi:hydroxymethylbilane synthase